MPSLDAAAQGSYTVRRGPLAATYRARFVLIGSMNPEEGRLRPQIHGPLRVARALCAAWKILLSVLKPTAGVQAYLANPRGMAPSIFGNEMLAAAEEIQSARELLPRVVPAR